MFQVHQASVFSSMPRRATDEHKRELKSLFGSAPPGLIFVTAFPDCKTYGKFHSSIAWETEVWIADAPDHMIHYNGKRFLGSYP